MKQSFVLTIINEIESSNPPARFLKKNDITDNWDVVSNNVVLKKVHNAFIHAKQNIQITRPTNLRITTNSIIIEPQPNDVLLGQFSKWHGNVMLQNLVSEISTLYKKGTNLQKTQLILSVLIKMESLTPPARYVY